MSKLLITIFLMLTLLPQSKATEINPVPVTNKQPIHRVAGYVKANLRSMLSAKEAGIVTFIATEGEMVTKGQLVAKVDDKSLLLTKQRLENEVAQSTQQLAYHKRQAERLEGMQGEKLVSQSQIDEINFSVSKSAMQLAIAKNRLNEVAYRLEHTAVYAQFSGVVIKREASLGEFMTAGAPLVEIVSIDDLEIVTNVSTTLAESFSEASRFKVESSRTQGEAVLRTIIPDVDPTTQTVQVRLAPVDVARWTAGELVDLIVPGEQEFKISKQAITEKNGQVKVQVRRDEQLVSVDITVVSESGDEAIVRGKLAQTDKVQLTGA